MKKFVAIMVIAGLVVGGVALVSAQAARPFPTMVKATADGGKIASTAGVAVGFNYTTGFEAAEGFVPGYIKDQPCASGLYCWGVTGSANRSLVEGHVDTIHPYAGDQHLRLSHDPTTRTNQPNFGLGIDARIPEAADVVPQPVTKNSVSVMVAIDTPFGMDFKVQPQANTQGFLSSAALFFYYGGIYILDNPGTGLAFLGTGFNWDMSGNYQNYTVVMDPCNNTLDYFYGGVQIWSSLAGVYAGTALEQILVYGDNFPGSSMDFDDLVAVTFDPEPPVCGDGFISTACGEQCEPSDDSLCPGRCNPADCQCAPICTFDEPCMLENGMNGPYVSSSGYYLYQADTPFVSMNACDTIQSPDTLMAIFDAATGGFITYNDDCNDGPYGAYADPSAPCYNSGAANQYNSCLCFPAAFGQLFLVWVPDYNQNPPAMGSTQWIEVNKKIECYVAWEGGACCDTNNRISGPQGCFDNVLPQDCTASDQTFTLNKLCETLEPCLCIPDCVGRVCGDDGCGGTCGSCDDQDACTIDTCTVDGLCTYEDVNCDDGLFCTDDGCNPASGCFHNPHNCNDGVACTVDSCNEDFNRCDHDPDDAVCSDGLWCTGAEFCDVQLGCQDGADPCRADQVCDEEKEICEPGAIPTVSTWGMVILALLLLTGAKVYFGRRQALA